MFSSFFKETEVHLDAKSMEQFYKDVVKAIEGVRRAVPKADDDPGFRKAANILQQVADIGCQMETVPALEAQSLDAKRKELIPHIGEARTIEVTGEASKQLAKRYIELLQGVIDKKYWPVSSCPTFFGQSFLTVYASSFEKRRGYIAQEIETLRSRLEAHQPMQRMVV